MSNKLIAAVVLLVASTIFWCISLHYAFQYGFSIERDVRFAIWDSFLLGISGLFIAVFVDAMVSSITLSKDEYIECFMLSFSVPLTVLMALQAYGAYTGNDVPFGIGMYIGSDIVPIILAGSSVFLVIAIIKYLAHTGVGAIADLITGTNGHIKFAVGVLVILILIWLYFADAFRANPRGESPSKYHTGRFDRGSSTTPNRPDADKLKSDTSAGNSKEVADDGAAHDQGDQVPQKKPARPARHGHDRSQTITTSDGTVLTNSHDRGQSIMEQPDQKD